MPQRLDAAVLCPEGTLENHPFGLEWGDEQKGLFFVNDCAHKAFAGGGQNTMRKQQSHQRGKNHKTLAKCFDSALLTLLRALC